MISVYPTIDTKASQRSGDTRTLAPPRVRRAAPGRTREGSVITKQLRGAVLTIAVITASGCFNRVSEYPTEWPSLTRSSSAVGSACPDIAGTYSNLSARRTVANVDSHRLSLIKTLYSVIRAEEPFGSSTVEISQSAAELINVKADNGWDFMLDSTKGHFSCSEGAVNLNADFSFYGDAFGLGMGKVNYTLLRSDDLSLVAKRREYVGGVLLVIPAGATEQDWFLWERAE